MTVRILTGDCRDVLATLPDESVHCVVTSPPYFGLRDYGTAKWEGGDTDCDHVAQSRPAVLGSSSTLGFPSDGGPRRIAAGNNYHEAYTAQFRKQCGKCGAARIDNQIGLEATPDAFVAEMVAVFADLRRVLRSDGTAWLNLGDSYASGGRGGGADNSKQQTNVGALLGAKKAPDGFKAKDLLGIPWRVAFALQADGWYLRQDIIWSKPNPMPESVRDRCTKAHEYLFLLSKSERYHYDADAIKEDAIYGANERPYRTGEAYIHDAAFDNSGGIVRARRESKKRGEFNGKTNALEGREAFRAITDKRNKRSVWEIATQPYSDAHFATFPPALIEPCIMAGCPKGGVVLDPFGGAGTTGLVADRLGRDAILIELNPEYAAMADRRIRGDAGMFATVAAE